ncbi:MAG: tRNA dihydrouridine synthase DusB [Desulfitobacteriia bacterium]|jgi:tRNA-dihydrouridine synthase B
MKIGKFNLGTPVFMAPMAGITDKAFREVIRLTGGRYLFTEMISAKALLYGNSKTFKMLNIKDEKEPRIVQLFGSEPQTMAKAASIAVQQGVDIIDINMGCPTPKIVRNGEGAALLKNIPLAVNIASEVVNRVDVPVTVKIRLGWDQSSLVAPELAQRLESVGVSMITVHGRTREQFYSGQADWKAIGEVKTRVKIPVIGNGDILGSEDAQNMIRMTGCDGVMVARGALGKPWLIGIIQKFLENGDLVPEPTDEEKYQILVTHFEKLLFYKGEKIGVNEIRKHAAWYFKGKRGAAHYRNQIMGLQKIEDFYEVFKNVFLRNP